MPVPERQTANAIMVGSGKGIKRLVQQTGTVGWERQGRNKEYVINPTRVGVHKHQTVRGRWRNNARELRCRGREGVIPRGPRSEPAIQRITARARERLLANCDRALVRRAFIDR